MARPKQFLICVFTICRQDLLFSGWIFQHSQSTWQSVASDFKSCYTANYYIIWCHITSHNDVYPLISAPLFFFSLSSQRVHAISAKITVKSSRSPLKFHYDDRFTVSLWRQQLTGSAKFHGKTSFYLYACIWDDHWPRNKCNCKDRHETNVTDENIIEMIVDHETNVTKENVTEKIAMKQMSHRKM